MSTTNADASPLSLKYNLNRLRRKYHQYFMRYPVTRKPSSVFGLKYLPTLEPHYSDDSDYIYGKRGGVEAEATPRNLKKLEEIFLLKKQACRLILEIGVCRNGEGSFTHVFLNHKRDQTTFLGIDIDDKSFLDDPQKNIYTLRTDSTNQSGIRVKIQELGHHHIDVLFIDGWHSVNMVINDWKYADLLADDGMVIMHDTNCHPGPVCVYQAVDKNLFNKKKFFEKDPDWGMAVFYRKKNP